MKRILILLCVLTWATLTAAEGRAFFLKDNSPMISD